MPEPEAEDAVLAGYWVDWMSEHWRGVRRGDGQPLLLEFTVTARSIDHLILVEFAPAGLHAAIPQLSALGITLGFAEDEAWGALGTAAEDVAVSAALRSTGRDVVTVSDVLRPGFTNEQSSGDAFLWQPRPPD